jgi:hypothetical protein
MLLNWQTAQYFEAVPVVKLSRDISQNWVELRKWESPLVDITEGFVES